jgi:CDP-paratose 2-epimerase
MTKRQQGAHRFAQSKGDVVRWLITGGAGFIGTNLATHVVERGDEVIILDDLSRSGSEVNAKFLESELGLRVNRVDVSRKDELGEFLIAERPFDAIAHLAGQVSFLASLDDPRRDFEVNALGTLNVLEHVRLRSPETIVIGMSSNKVYGDLTELAYIEEPTRYVARDYPEGFAEDMPLAFHGPYGCSKGTADQYLVDYARLFGLRTASLRQSSVYGAHQHPRSDQGWVAHLLEEAVARNTIQLNGVGKQVRDLLHATDLARLFVALVERIQPGSGNAFNVGGGPANALSILELFEWIEESTGKEVDFRTGQPRPSDQLVFISNNAYVTEVTGWTPKVSVDTGLTMLLAASGG